MFLSLTPSKHACVFAGSIFFIITFQYWYHNVRAFTLKFRSLCNTYWKFWNCNTFLFAFYSSSNVCSKQNRIIYNEPGIFKLFGGVIYPLKVSSFFPLFVVMKVPTYVQGTEVLNLVYLWKDIDIIFCLLPQKTYFYPWTFSSCSDVRLCIIWYRTVPDTSLWSHYWQRK